MADGFAVTINAIECNNSDALTLGCSMRQDMAIAKPEPSAQERFFEGEGGQTRVPQDSLSLRNNLKISKVSNRVSTGTEALLWSPNGNF